MSFGIEINSLEKRFGRETILKDIHLKIQPGEFAMLVGPSGCGKTTLLRIMGALEGTSAGSIQLTCDGKPISRKESAQVGFQFAVSS